jgi:hypothetical protein
MSPSFIRQYMLKLSSKEERIVPARRAFLEVIHPAEAITMVRA